MDQQPRTVSDIFRRAQAVRVEHPEWSYKQVRDFLVNECSGTAFPPLDTLTIPEQDDRAPEEDWTAGLPIISRGIQFQDWKEIADGIVLSLEQTENYERAAAQKEIATSGTIATLASMKRLQKVSVSGCRKS